MPVRNSHLLLAIWAVLLATASPGLGATGLESPWLEGYKTRTRLLAGRTGAGDGARLLAFVEIGMPAGWKTYWRNPGDAGGLPPVFNWSKSENLASATVLYPAPKRMVDRSGNTIGYMDHVLFPVEISAKDEGKPIGLALTLAFGICKDICVPVDVELALEVPPAAVDGAPPAALEALEQVPRREGERRPGDPHLSRVEARLDDANPRLVLEADFPGDGKGADIFLEAPEGLYVPLPVKTLDRGGGHLTFEVDLGSDVDLAALKGKTLTATLVGDNGASVATFRTD